jgi:hypothetical protein
VREPCGVGLQRRSGLARTMRSGHSATSVAYKVLGAFAVAWLRPVLLLPTSSGGYDGDAGGCVVDAASPKSCLFLACPAEQCMCELQWKWVLTHITTTAMPTGY